MSIISDDSLVVYTVIMGTDYDLPHTIADKNVCYICFTDNPEKDYDITITHPELRGVFHNLALFQFT